MPIDQLKRAIAIREKIDALTLELNELMGGHEFISTNGIHSNGSRGRTASAQGLRWTSPTRNGHGMGLKKPRLSAEGRAKVSAAVKARWERFRAAKARLARAK